MNKNLIKVKKIVVLVIKPRAPGMLGKHSTIPSPQNQFYFILLFLAVLEFELGALNMLGKHSTIELYPSPV
jgi:hypothetical protein